MVMMVMIMVVAMVIMVMVVVTAMPIIVMIVVVIMMVMVMLFHQMLHLRFHDQILMFHSCQDLLAFQLIPRSRDDRSLRILFTIYILSVHPHYRHSHIDFFKDILISCFHLLLNRAFKFPTVNTPRLHLPTPHWS